MGVGCHLTPGRTVPDNRKNQRYNGRHQPGQALLGQRQTLCPGWQNFRER